MAYFNGKKVLSVDLKTKVPTAQLEITENGEYNVMQYGSVDVDVPVPPTPSGNQDISTLNEYDVSAKATARISAAERAKIIPANIADGVTILGVAGTHQGGGGGGGITTTFPNSMNLRIYYDIADSYYYDGVTIGVYRGSTAFATTTLIQEEDYCLGINYFDVSLAAALGQWVTITYTQYKNYGGYTPKIVLKHYGNAGQVTYSSWDDINDNTKAISVQYQLSSNKNQITFKIENSAGYGYAIYLAAEYED